MSMIPHYLLEARGRSPRTTAKVLCNKLLYAGVRIIGKPPREGWVHSHLHWSRYPFSLRRETLWSSPLRAWFCPADESAIECMLHLPNYEPVRWVAPRPGEVFLDAGAYVGWYSIQAARAVGPSGRVIALEPDPVNRSQLERNLKLNDIQNTTVVPCAVWSGTGRVGWRPGDQPVWHRVGEAGESGKIEAISVDDLVKRLGLPRVDWIKLDIEGAEVEALRGASETLRRFRPTLFIEVHETREPVCTLLTQFGYSLEREQYDQPPDRHGWILAPRS